MTTIAPAAATSGFSTGLTQSTASIASNFQTFLTLLTTQLQAQDPLNPMDTNEFTQQLVQFSGVEQQIRTNQSLESLQKTLQASAAASAVGYLGRSAVALTDRAALRDGQASWTYELPEDAASATFTVRDAAGRTVATLSGERGRGTHEIAWNGRDLSGREAAPGVYSLTIAAKGADERTIAPILRRTGVISEVDLSSATPSVTIDGVTTALANVQRVKTNLDNSGL